MTSEETDHARLAALIDGEGTVSATIRGSQNLPMPYIVVSNTDERLINWIVERYPGSKAGPYKNQSPRSKPIMQWRLYSAQDIPIVGRAVHQYLVIKKYQLDLVIEMCSMIKPRGVKGSLDQEHQAKLITLGGILQAINRGNRGRPERWA
jgi:hypothetical protein